VRVGRISTAGGAAISPSTGRSVNGDAISRLDGSRRVEQRLEIVLLAPKRHVWNAAALPTSADRCSGLSYEGLLSRTHWSEEPEAMGLLSEGVISFTDWVQMVEPKLRHALTGSFGSQRGREATADALAFVWEHWDEVSVKDNPLGYAYGVGRNMARRGARRRPVWLPVDEERLPNVEPGLPGAIADLPERQRVVITLVYGYQWSLSEVAELLGTSKSTVQNHAERGLARLRKSLGVAL
jgi:DNA-directed RNA polymerase specialized sigma24 family protein